MSTESSRDVKMSFEVEGPRKPLQLVRLEGTEGVSRLFRFDLELAHEDPDLSFADVIGKPALVTLSRDGRERYIHGMVNSLELLGQTSRYSLYAAELVPKVWRLQHFRDSRIFQNKSTEEIVAKVLEDAGIPSEMYKICLAYDERTYKREYCVQYRESHWAFISRLLEELGFFYFFKHSKTTHQLVIGNEKSFHVAIDGAAELPFHPPSPTLPAEEHVTAFTFQETVRPTKVTLADFNPLRPSLDLKTEKKASKAQRDRDKTLEVYDYPAEYTIPEKGLMKAKIRLEELQSLSNVGEGVSDCVRFFAGAHFKLGGHPRKDLDGTSFVLIKVHHVCEKPPETEAGAASPRAQYHNRFLCIPRRVPFRPDQVTPRPTARGVQTATVVGPAGEEIYTDDLGRVKVQFHWDREGRFDESSSCWVHVSQVWAGQGWGSIWIPRIADEVIVDFIEGDLDRPIVVGRVYHAQNVPPYPLPREKTRGGIKTRSTPGGGGSNEIRFEDKKGSEELYVHAQKDQKTKVENDQSLAVGGNRTATVDGSENITVKGKQASGGVTGASLSITGDGKADATKTIEVQAGTHIQLTSGDGTILVEPGKITITSAGKVTITAPKVEVAGALVDLTQVPTDPLVKGLVFNIALLAFIAAMQAALSAPQPPPIDPSWIAYRTAMTAACSAIMAAAPTWLSLVAKTG
jgi:type VI secretion system secreted protein VgrG